MWITGSLLTQVRGGPPGHWGQVLRPLALPDTGHSGTFNSNNCDCPIFISIKQILFVEAYQRLMQMMNPPQNVPIRRFLLREDRIQLLSSKLLLQDFTPDTDNTATPGISLPRAVTRRGNVSAVSGGSAGRAAATSVPSVSSLPRTRLNGEDTLNCDYITH